MTEDQAGRRILLIDRIRACGAGAFAGAAVVVVGLIAWLVLTSPPQDPSVPGPPWSMALAMVLMLSAYALVIAFCIFFVGTLVVGLPAWLLLERVGQRRRLRATIAGGVLAGLTASILLLWMGGWSDWLAALAAFPQLGLAGAAAGWTLHRVAYGKARSPKP